jgi:hypothetical protein
MNRLLTLCMSMLLTNVAAAQIFECIDAKGRREYAQVCPPGTAKETLLMKSGAGASGPTPAGTSLGERDADFKKRALERQEAETKADKANAEAKDAERNCGDARSQLKLLQDGGRIGRTDPVTGERSFLEDADRPAEIARAQKAVDGWCKK